MSKRNAAFFELAPDVLAELLHMPDNHKIAAIEWSYTKQVAKIVVEGPDLPEWKQGRVLPQVTPQITTKQDAKTGRITYEWEWGDVKDRPVYD